MRLTITAGTDVLDAVGVALLRLDDLPEILRAVVRDASRRVLRGGVVVALPARQRAAGSSWRTVR